MEALLAGWLVALPLRTAPAQMNVNPYFIPINYPVGRHTLMVMARPDFQSARYGSDFFTAMLMAEYGLTSRWTIGVMAEGQKIHGLPVTYGGVRVSTYVHLFRDARWLNLTLYGEYEDLNEASLYKMEVAGFGPEDLTEPLALARHTPVRTFEQRVLVYHDRGRWNGTLNIIRETALQSPHGSDYGYAIGVFRKPIVPAPSMATMDAMPDTTPPPALSLRRVGYGVELAGTLGDDQRFGFVSSAQQQYVGAVFTYDVSGRASLHLEPAIGLSHVSDPFMLRVAVSYMFGDPTVR